MLMSNSPPPRPRPGLDLMLGNPQPGFGGTIGGTSSPPTMSGLPGQPPPNAIVPYTNGVNGMNGHYGMNGHHGMNGHYGMDGHMTQSGGRVKHIPLAKCRVLYLGSAVPLETAVGLDAVQQPLKERYPYDKDGDVNGIDAWVTIFSSGLQMQFIGDKNTVTWFPIPTLHVCAAVKCVVSINGSTGERNANFVALDTPAGRSSSHPPMFAAIMRRTKGVKVLECHVFICKSDQAAMAMVQSCTHAYEHREGWTDEAAPIEIHKAAPLHLMPAEPIKHDDAPPEFYAPPPTQGYYYTSRKDLVKNYNVFGNNTQQSTQNTEMTVARRPALPPPARMQVQTQPMPGTMHRGGLYVMGPPPPPLPQVMPQRVSVGPPIPMMTQVPVAAPVPVPAPMPAPVPMGYFPVPPPGYFADWDNFAGQPVVAFPPHPDDQYRPMYRSRSRRPRSPRRKHVSKTRYRSPERAYRSVSPRRAISPGPVAPMAIGAPLAITQGPIYQSARPRTPPADYDRTYQRQDQDPDLFLYAERYNNEGDEFFYNRNQSPQRNGEYHYNQEIFMRKGQTREREYEEQERYATHIPRDEDQGLLENDAAASPQERRYPRQDREFGNSIREEREALGGFDNYPNPYKLNDYRYDKGPEGAGFNMERELGYFP